MGGQQNVDRVVDVSPLGVMIGFFGNKRHLRHETEGCREIPECEALADRVP